MIFGKKQYIRYIIARVAYNDDIVLPVNLLDFLSISRFVFQLSRFIENQFVSLISDPKAAKIKVQKPTIIAQEGSVATLSVYVYGDPRPDVYWKKGSREIDVRRGKYKIVNGGSLQVILLTFCH